MNPLNPGRTKSALNPITTRDVERMARDMKPAKIRMWTIPAVR